MLLNLKETSEMLKIKDSTLYAWVHQKKIPHIKFSKKHLCFDYNELVKFIEQGKVA